MNRGFRKLIMLVLALCVLSGTAVRAEEENTVSLPNGKQIYNLLLIGSDQRDESWNGNSDVMMVATVNTAVPKLSITSFMRDLYADIPGYGVHKLNYAYAAAGPEKLVETLEDNYEIEIDNYAVVNFESMAKVIDIAGGVEMTISDAECDLLNGYLISMSATEYSLPCGGTYVLNGTQAVAFMRDRFVGNNDYQRTQRQRDVLRSLFDSMQDMEAVDLVKLAGYVFATVETDIDALTMLKLSGGISEWIHWTLEEDRVPYDDLYHSKSEMLVPDFHATIERLYEHMYEGIDMTE